MNKKCLGCGIVLQDFDKLADGYVSCLDKDLCERCFIIKNYGQNKTITKNNNDYIAIINNIREDDLVVYVSSLLTLKIDLLDKFKNIMLVLTKRDILPKSIKDKKIINYIKKRYNNILDVIEVSAYKKYNIDVLYDKLIKYGQNRSIYFVGATNSGKSTLINQIQDSYGKEKGNITTSNYPSTTLGIVSIHVGDITINDTPGLINNASIINYLDNEIIKKINAKKEIKPITLQIKGTGAILVDNLIRIEYETITSSITFYISNNININQISLKNPQFKNYQFTSYNILDNKDIVIDDLGFIKCTNKLTMKIFSKNKISVRIRDNLI